MGIKVAKKDLIQICDWTTCGAQIGTTLRSISPILAHASPRNPLKWATFGRAVHMGEGGHKRIVLCLNALDFIRSKSGPK